MTDFSTNSLPINFGVFSVGAVLVWLAGTKLSKYVDLIADRTGLGKAFAGALLLGGATSLPELATTLTAAWSNAAEMAGANSLEIVLEIALFLPAELAYRDGPIISAMNPADAFLGAIGVTVTAVYLWGILERRDRTVMGMGIDSLVVLIVYLGGLVVYSRL